MSNKRPISNYPVTGNTRLLSKEEYIRHLNGMTTRVVFDGETENLYIMKETLDYAEKERGFDMRKEREAFRELCQNLDIDEKRLKKLEEICKKRSRKK